MCGTQDWWILTRCVIYSGPYCRCFGSSQGSKVYAAIHVKNITPAFTVIVILNVELICVNHNSKCHYRHITHKDVFVPFHFGFHLPDSWAIQNPSPISIIWRQSTILVWNLQLSIFSTCDWRAGGGPLKLDTELGLTLVYRTISSLISNPCPLP